MGIGNGITFSIQVQKTTDYFLININSKLLRMSNEKYEKLSICSAKFWLNRAKSRIREKKGLSVIFKL